MRYELFVYDNEELIHNQQAALADLIASLIDLDYESGYEFAPWAWVIMQKPTEGGSWECYWSEGGGQELHYKKMMEE